MVLAVERLACARVCQGELSAQELTADSPVAADPCRTDMRSAVAPASCPLLVKVESDVRASAFLRSQPRFARGGGFSHRRNPQVLRTGCDATGAFGGVSPQRGDVIARMMAAHHRQITECQTPLRLRGENFGRGG